MYCGKRGFDGRGSSPLTRGKLGKCNIMLDNDGLIPAHAGKTSAPCRSRPGSRAHPRSRGENIAAYADAQSVGGSSPLTRGKPRCRISPVSWRRLIPAHAGKTPCCPAPCRSTRAHPRSRGENRTGRLCTAMIVGSSPLTRGKQSRPRCAPNLVGLIPAHAGKTARACVHYRAYRAHPRSRGENCSRGERTARSAGSSPLTRGKPR